MKPLSKNLLQFFYCKKVCKNSYYYCFSEQEFFNTLFLRSGFSFVEIVLFRNLYKQKASGALFLRMLFSFPQPFLYVRFLFSFVYVPLRIFVNPPLNPWGGFVLCKPSPQSDSEYNSHIGSTMEFASIPYTESRIQYKLRNSIFSSSETPKHPT